MQRRRERGRRAQSAFRKRQIQAKIDLDTRHNHLREALDAILQSIQPNDRAELVASIRAAAAMLDEQKSASESSLTSFLGNEQQRSDESLLVVSTPQTDLASSIVSIGDNEYAEQRDIRDLSISAARDPPTILATPGSLSIPNDPLQRVICDNWLGSIFPFVGAGAFTLAGRLFWRLTARWEAQLKAELDVRPSGHSSSTLRETVPWPSLQDLMHSSMQRVQHDFDVEAWQGMVDSRLQYSQCRGILSVRTATSHGGELRGQRWLTPAQVEERIRFVVGDEVFAVLAQPTLEKWERSGQVLSAIDSVGSTTSSGEEEEGALIDGLLDWAVEHYACFGNGPRWDLGQFDEGLKAWCLRATARAAPVV